jgi:hypothetical protein
MLFRASAGGRAVDRRRNRVGQHVPQLGGCVLGVLKGGLEQPVVGCVAHGSSQSLGLLRS